MLRSVDERNLDLPVDRNVAGQDSRIRDKLRPRTVAAWVFGVAWRLARAEPIIELAVRQKITSLEVFQ